MTKPDKASKKASSKARVDELTTDLQRLQADFANYKRRSEEERVSLANFVKQQVIVELLPVLDNLERAIAHAPKELKKNEWAMGVEKVAQQLLHQLEQMGVKKIATVGEEFDPHLHEAVSVEDGDGTKEIISQELQAGYMPNDEVIRHAMVKVKRS